MFKSLLAATTIALATALPSFAAPSTCWIGANAEDGSIPAQTCDVSVRTNANGHKVLDVYTPVDGTTVTIMLWYDNDRTPTYAEVIFDDGSKVNMNYRWDIEGDLHLHGKNGEFYVAL